MMEIFVGGTQMLEILAGWSELAEKSLETGNEVKGFATGRPVSVRSSAAAALTTRC